MEIVVATVVIVLVQAVFGFVILGKLEKIEQGLKSPVQKEIFVSYDSISKASDHIKSVRDF